MEQIAKTTAAAILVAAIATTPVWAEGESEGLSDNPDISEGTQLLNRGFKLLLEGLSKEVEPMADKWAEGWANLVERFGDMSVYYPPETLPNGDIIIRRRTPLAPNDSLPGETEL
ncbi:hypothetical protein [Aliiroseovarius sediminis]|nr:hypothetical protein [Aliiroseovarius sediminis]MCI2394151.1 hypothetical protein [Aliiroseovarius sediminis]